MPPPDLTIVTACFNAAGTIEDTILSVHSQRDVSCEHIVIDGGSSDGTLEILTKHRSKFSHLVSEKDRGVYDAMQKGLTLARGQYTGFLNADDYYTGPMVLSKLFNAVRQGQFCGISGMVEQIDAQNIVRRRIGRKAASDADLLWGKFPPHPGTLLRTDLMRLAGGFKLDYSVAGDFDLYLRVRKLSSDQMCHVTLPVTCMRMGGLSTKNNVKNYLMVGDEIYRALLECGYPASRIKAHLRMLWKAIEFF